MFLRYVVLDVCIRGSLSVASATAVNAPQPAPMTPVQGDTDDILAYRRQFRGKEQDQIRALYSDIQHRADFLTDTEIAELLHNWDSLNAM